jgi:hypothetical protein
MAAMRCLFWVPAACLWLPALRADVRGCVCDPATPATMEKRECALTREALSQPAGVEFFFLKDNSPRKPNRWLVLPTGAGPERQFFDQVPPDLRVQLWKAAIVKGQELFGNEWGLAYNAPSVRTQCHMHLHIGRFIKAAENSRFKVVTKVEDLPAPETEGVWIHPAGNGYHVHYGELITETALVR